MRISKYPVTAARSSCGSVGSNNKPGYTSSQMSAYEIKERRRRKRKKEEEALQLQRVQSYEAVFAGL
jgi:hypothetical protein